MIKDCKLVEEKIKIENEITIEELSKHRKKTDCWISYNNKVYNISSYISRHPGGKIIMQAAGADAKALIEKYHPWVSVLSVIRNMEIGTLKTNN